MLKVLLTAVATGAVVLAVLNGFGIVKLQPKAVRRRHRGRSCPWSRRRWRLRSVAFQSSATRSRRTSGIAFAASS